MAKRKTVSAPDHLTIDVPIDGFTEEIIKNLQAMIQAKSELIKKSLSIDELPIEVSKTEISFPWFKAETDGEHINAYAQFITHLCKTAKTKKRVMTETKEVANEKFRMRVFCISLGMIGDEFKLARKLLGQNLSGNSAWSSGIDPRRKTPIEAAEAAPAAEPKKLIPNEAQSPEIEA